MKNLATTCFDAIQEMILVGTLRPGEQIKIDALAESLGVGLSPAREALAKLSATKLVENKDKRGFFVTPLDAQTVKDTMLTIFEIESLVLVSAMENGDDAWEQNIVATLYGLKQVETGEPVSIEKWLPRNEAFHDAIASGCNLKRLLAIRNELRLEHRRLSCFSFARRHQASLAANHDEHRALADAVLKRKRKPALDLLRQHLIGDLDEYLRPFRA